MPSTATITSTDFTAFVARTKIKSAEVNSNFNLWRGHNIPVDASSSAAAHNSYDLGSSDHRWRYMYGSKIHAVAQTTGSMTVVTTTDVYLISASGGTATATLPAVSGVPDGWSCKIKKTDTSANSVFVDGNGSETIDSTTGVNIITYNDCVEFMKYGAGWYRI